ncbi:PEP-CTERM sorting domain-containing protein [Xylophilus rhododendri]|uniref:PEP-CTERM sorting domain-containing protein n=1 Tax=Xylophilus rhododendri TaxID=2697032 RepID=A0A857JCK3_9BURK|nr:FxDxF family PEP-CTERM protein [Xylophilus rhododendri]QHJ00693.1 PEP-CTERM sorting domain-containing protein [Xylophilus rhododendri]
MRPIFKKLCLAGALVLSLGSSLAEAATVDLGTVSGTTTTGSSTSSGSFSDLYNFSVGANDGTAFVSSAVTFGSYGVTLSSISLYAGTFTSASALSGLTAIFSSSSTSLVNLGNGIYSNTVSGATVSLSSLSDYTLVVTGTSAGSSAYTTLISVAAVPEPESYAMLLAGLGLMGCVVRRRSSKR